MTNKQEKWYSNGLTEAEAKKLVKQNAVIRVPEDVLSGEASQIYLELRGSHGLSSYHVMSPEDIAKLLHLSKRNSERDLDGLVVEEYVTYIGWFAESKGISIDQKLQQKLQYTQ